jgi:hypothetical protein
MAIDTTIARFVGLVAVNNIEFLAHLFMTLKTFARPGNLAPLMTFPAILLIGIVHHIPDQSRPVTAVGTMTGYTGSFIDFNRQFPVRGFDDGAMTRNTQPIRLIIEELILIGKMGLMAGLTISGRKRLVFCFKFANQIFVALETSSA